MHEEQYDVVVVGGGGSGLAASIEAATLGRSVVLLEKNAHLGGSTAWSVGSVTSSATAYQSRRGIKDNPAGHWSDMPGFATGMDRGDNDEMRQILCDSMPDTFSWLLDAGIRFYGPMPEPPHQRPRMHNVLPNSLSFIAHLQKWAIRKGVVIKTGVRASSLVQEEGRVTGVKVDFGKSSLIFKARGAVVLATGDFTSDPDLKAKYMGQSAALVEGINPTATGDGQKLAMALGGRILNGDLALGPELRFIPPQRTNWLRLLPPWKGLANLMAWSMDHVPQWLLRPFIMSFLTTALAPSPNLFGEGSILVNSQGERFADEGSTPAAALAAQPGKVGYIILDARLTSLFQQWPNFISTAPGVAYAYINDYRRSRPDVFRIASSIEALAAHLEVPKENLTRSLKSAQLRQDGIHPMGPGPYVSLGPVKPVFVHNEGGLAVDTSHRVLDESDTPIPGLYAAGSTGQGGLLLKGHGHHLAWAFVSGRRAGRLAAFEAVSA